MKIYTKTGDSGETSLFSGQRVPKNDPYLDALGTVDELNSALGLAISHLDENSFKKEIGELEIVQHALFDLGASLATPQNHSSKSKIEKTRFDQEEVEIVEKWIDEMQEGLPKLHTFILPGGNPAGAALHLARSICRRAERLVTPIYKNGDISSSVVVYLNRLSDYLFVLSRHTNQKVKTPETLWRPHLLSQT